MLGALCLDLAAREDWQRLPYCRAGSGNGGRGAEALLTRRPDAAVGVMRLRFVGLGVGVRLGFVALVLCINYQRCLINCL